jgi:hypothetical protein
MKLSVEATQDIQADIRRLDAAIDWAERAWGRIVSIRFPVYDRASGHLIFSLCALASCLKH